MAHVPDESTAIQMSAEQHLTGIINCQNGFALGATKTSGSGSFEFLAADRAFEDLRKWTYLGPFPFLGKEGYRFFQVLLDIEELGETQKLKHFVHLGLDLQQDKIPAPRLDGFEKGCKGTDAGSGDVVQTGAVEDQSGEA